MYDSPSCAAHTISCAFHASTILCGSKLRSFSKYPPLWKKAGKANKSHAKTDSSPPVNQAGAPTATDEIYDMAELESSILKAIEKLTHDLAQLRSGGRLNPDIVESLKVQLGTAGQGKETVRLGDIAQVVPRGRVLNVICGDDTVRKHKCWERPLLTIYSTSSLLPPLSPLLHTPLRLLRRNRAIPLPSKFLFHHRQVIHDEKR